VQSTEEEARFSGKSGQEGERVTLSLKWDMNRISQKQGPALMSQEWTKGSQSSSLSLAWMSPWSGFYFVEVFFFFKLTFFWQGRKLRWKSAAWYKFEKFHQFFLGEARVQGTPKHPVLGSSPALSLSSQCKRLSHLGTAGHSRVQPWPPARTSVAHIAPCTLLVQHDQN
jgi:hypothetical protein